MAARYRACASRAQRHRENRRSKVHLKPVFSVSLWLCVSVLSGHTLQYFRNAVLRLDHADHTGTKDIEMLPDVPASFGPPEGVADIRQAAIPSAVLGGEGRGRFRGSRLLPGDHRRERVWQK